MRYLFLLCFSLVFCCCSNHENERKELDRVESLIKVDPANALVVLDSLYKAEASLFAEPDFQARYILLNEYAKYRNGIDENNDSLICIAEEYYKQNDRDKELMLCLFLHGTILLDKQIFGPCMQCLSQAADLAEKLGDNFMLGQIYTNLHLLCSDVYNADATEYARKALEAYKKHGNPLYVMDGEVNLSIAHFNNREYAVSELLLDSALVRADALGDDFVALKCIRYKMYIQVGRQEWSHAISSYQTLKNTYGKRVCMEDYAHIAIAYAALQQRDSAEFYLNRARKDNYKVVNNELLYLNSAHRVYKFLKVYEQSAEYGQIYQIKRDSIYWTRLKNSVMREQYATVQQKLSDSESIIDILLWIVGSLMFCLVPLASLLYILSIKRKAEREVLRHLEEEKKLRNENYEKSVLIVKQSSVVCDLRRYIMKKEIVPQTKWAELDLLFSDTLPDFEARLKQNGAVSEPVWRISLLIKLDFTIDEIALLMNKASSSISSICNRASKKHFGVDSGAKEWREYVLNL